MCFLKNDPRSDDFAKFGVRNRDYCCFPNCGGVCEDVLDADREEVLKAKLMGTGRWCTLCELPLHLE
jgi:hypothetical protein